MINFVVHFPHCWLVCKDCDSIHLNKRVWSSILTNHVPDRLMGCIYKELLSADNTHDSYHRKGSLTWVLRIDSCTDGSCLWCKKSEVTSFHSGTLILLRSHLLINYFVPHRKINSPHVNRWVLILHTRCLATTVGFISDQGTVEGLQRDGRYVPDELRSKGNVLLLYLQIEEIR